eukprot:657261_1
MKPGDTRLLSCGFGAFGTLGLGEDDCCEAEIPTILPVSRNVNFVSICAGSFSNAAIDSDGQLWTWGQQDGGGLGRDGGEFSPERVSLPARVKKMSAGDEHMAALLEDGRVFCWGAFKNDGRVGHHLDSAGEVVDTQPTPFEIEFPTSKPMIDVASGANHVVTLSSAGDVYAWGVTVFGTLTSKRLYTQQMSPRIVATVKSKKMKLKFRAIFCGSHNIFAVNRDGLLFAMGQDIFGQLGDPEKEYEMHANNSLRPIPALSGKRVRSVSAGAHHVLCLTEEGEAFSWGRNASGMLGRVTLCPPKEFESVTPEVNPSPTPIFFANGCQIISTGEHHSHILQGGEVKAFGQASEHRLGTGDEEDPPIGTMDFVFTEEQLAGFEVKAISGGSQHTLFLLERPSILQKGHLKTMAINLPNDGGLIRWVKISVFYRFEASWIGEKCDGNIKFHKWELRL